MDAALSRPREAGVCLHVTSLPGHYGIGEIGADAMRFVLSLEAMGFGVWQILPTGPTGYGDSPYQPQSTFAGNELLIDIDALLQAGWLLREDVDDLKELPGDTVDFAELIPLKSEALRKAALRFLESAPRSEQDALQAFVEQHDQRWLHDYALYRVIKAQHDEKPWYEWPAALARRDAGAIAAVERDQADAIRVVKVQQFFFSQQWQRLRIYAAKHDVKLLGDMPIYIAFDSADAWAHPELLKLDADLRPLQVAGVPPDYFSADGQLWGNPVYDWERHEADGFRWWIDRIGHALTMTDILRIDHFRGFESYWAIPAGAETARDGQWVPAPGDALFAALQKNLGELPIVAEDLGVITDDVRALRDRYNLPGMKVLQFELFEDGFSLDRMAPRNICYTGTHDNDTLLGWFAGGPGDERTAEEVESTRHAVLEATGGAPESVHLDMFRMALRSPAQVAIAPMQDLLGMGSGSRMNVPGTTQGNWRWRMLPDSLAPERSEMLRNMVSESGRASLIVPAAD